MLGIFSKCLALNSSLPYLNISESMPIRDSLIYTSNGYKNDLTREFLVAKARSFRENLTYDNLSTVAIRASMLNVFWSISKISLWKK